MLKFTTIMIVVSISLDRTVFWNRIAHNSVDIVAEVVKQAMAIVGTSEQATIIQDSDMEPDQPKE